MKCIKFVLVKENLFFYFSIFFPFFSFFLFYGTYFSITCKTPLWTYQTFSRQMEHLFCATGMLYNDRNIYLVPSLLKLIPREVQYQFNPIKEP